MMEMKFAMHSMCVSFMRLLHGWPAANTAMCRMDVGCRVIPPWRRMILMPSIPKTATCVLGLFAVLLTLEGCFFFRSKPDPRAQEMTSRLNPGLTTDEVLELVGPPQRRGQNLFDKRKEYWIYEFVKEQKKSRKQSRSAERNGQETVLESELQLLFERGKLVNWNVVPINE
jgi:outer membrane protein assembly factor BamE (lipoprotein component of BamABCDE complex)